MSGPCTDCGGPDYRALEVRIAELEADLAEESRQADEAVDSCRERIAKLETDLADCAKTCGCLEYRLERAEYPRPEPRDNIKSIQRAWNKNRKREGGEK